MVTPLYAVAGLLLILTIVADSPFTKTYLVVFATASFLLARFIRIERRLDRIQGIQRSPRLKRAVSWAWSNGELFFSVAYLAFVAGLVWWYWGAVWSYWGSISDHLSTFSPERPHPWLHALLSNNRVWLVWFPLGAFFAWMFLFAIVADIWVAAMLLGFSGFFPRTSPQKTSGPSGWKEIVEWGGAVFGCWLLFVMIYAKKECDAFFAPLDHLSATQVCIAFGVLGAWLPLGFIAQAVQRRREKKKLGQPSR